MSVIGRMDKQVDDVLISPLARKNEQRKEDQESVEKPDSQAKAQPEFTSAQNRREEREALPVWLL